ncbi:FG-GAP repeat protein [Planctomycetes bacterium Poly30]|uniref:FG-GAP repeat protein n=1 Tax=Saltatorellus ferox TaxID=2528018 RepID=A0A518ET38_9BACT|nr:FG-GAP repeat protein [Planctomycetes bacterium Poly30]
MLLLTAAFFVFSPGIAPKQASPPEGTRFGRSVLALSDLDGDGIREIAVGAPNADGKRGLVLVLSGKTREILATWSGPAARSTFGHTLRSVQDVNGDGVDEVLVGFEFWERCELRSGKDGQLLHAMDRGWKEVIPVGDFDGDGAGDLLLTTGVHWEVRSGRTNELINDRSYAQTGGRLDPIGDVNGDGLVDGVYFGKNVVLMLSVRPDPKDFTLTSPFPTRRPSTLQDLWPSAFVGPDGETLRPVGAAAAGDLDGDGRQDLLVALVGKKSECVVGLSLEKRAAPLTRAERLAPDPLFGGDPTLGYAMLGGIDLDGDGRDDFVLGNPSPLGETQVVAVPGVADKPIRQGKWPDFQGACWFENLADHTATFGVSLAAFDDADGDGIWDVLVGHSDWFWTGTVYRGNSLRLLSGRTGRALWVVTEDQYDELGG